MADDEDYDSEDDVDYVPEAEDVSEEDHSGDEEDLSVLGSSDQISEPRRKQQTKNSALSLRKRQGGIKLDHEKTTEVGKDEENIKLAEQIELEKLDKKVTVEKKKADDLWSSFLSDVKVPPKKSNLGALPTLSKPKIESESKTSTSVAEKDSPAKMVKITKVFDFAGEEVKVTKTVAADSEEAIKEIKSQEEKKSEKASPVIGNTTGSVLSSIGIKRPAVGGGLGGILNKIGKKQKISVLDKSKMDWNNFKKDEGIEDELKLHNNSKEGYIERMKFLQRTDLREFEIERNIRMSNSKR